MLYEERHSHKRYWIAIGILVALFIGLFTLLASTYSDLELTKANLELTKAELSSTQNELSLRQAELASTQITLEATLNSLDSIEAELSDLQAKYESLASGYVVRNPNYREVKDFIARDKTDKKEYIEGRYTCVNFAADVKKNAMGENIRCAYVIIEFPKGGHTIVAFETVDEGLIYIEPQDDQEVEVKGGKRYNGYIIERVIVIW